VFESLQYGLVALVVPARLVLGGPFDHLRSSATLSVRVTALANRRQLRRGALATFPALGAYLAALTVWQLPVVVDGVRSSPVLVVAEVVTFLAIGTLFWSELVESAPFSPRTRGAVRVGVAVGPMWLVWVLAYLIGFAHSAWFHGFRHVGAAISPVADQQLATGVLWFVAATVFLPVIFVNFYRFLTEDEDRSEEIRTLLRRERRAFPSS
jgi:cytochrome c oxidase assembly factor CtaG